MVIIIIIIIIIIRALADWWINWCV